MNYFSFDHKIDFFKKKDTILDMALLALQQQIRALADSKKAVAQKRFFKTQPGDYGFEDQFLGLNVPTLRQIAKANQALDYAAIQQLLYSVYHEERMLAVLILVLKYQKSADGPRIDVYNFYMRHAKQVNNWDLVDTSAPAIPGCHLYRKSTAPLTAFARSSVLWERRIAIVATLYFIRHHYFKPTLRIAAMLLKDREALIHKATGWMLREVAQRDKEIALEFIEAYYPQLPRVALRYAIECLPDMERKQYLNWSLQ